MVFYPTTRLETNPHDGKTHVWTSRAHRKGKTLGGPPPPFSLSNFVKYYDVSWWTAFLFTIGSCFWVVNGVFAFHTPVQSAVALVNVEAITAFLGGFTFVLGGYSMYLEAQNEGNTAAFDRAVRREERDLVRHFKLLLTARARRTHLDLLKRPPDAQWRWIGWGSMRNISFAANVIQFLGTIVFFVSVVTVLPGVLPASEPAHRALYIVLLWLPQVIGAALLTVSSYLIMLENQHRAFYIPELTSLGFHVGLFNVIGSLGFFMSGLGGIIFSTAQTNQRLWSVAFSTYVGSYAFLLGSVLQYWEIVRI